MLLPVPCSLFLRGPLRSGTVGLAVQVYNKQGSLNTRVFWKSGVLMAAVDAALAFFIPYYSITASDHNSITDVYSVGKTVFIALLGAVSLEVGWLLFRGWTVRARLPQPLPGSYLQGCDSLKAATSICAAKQHAAAAIGFSQPGVCL